MSSTFNYAPGAPSVGIGSVLIFNPLPRLHSPSRIMSCFVDGADMGRASDPREGRAGVRALRETAYLRIDTADGSVVTSVGFENLTT